MRGPAAYQGTNVGRFWACLILSMFLLALLAVDPRSSGAAVSSAGFPVSSSPEDETQAAVSGNTAVWTVSRAGGLDIQGKNLSTGLDLLIPTQPGAQTRPAMSGRIVVWEDASSGNSNVYGYDILSRQKFPVAVGPGNQTRPAISGRDVVWEDDRDGGRDVYRFDLDTGQESPVTTAPGDQRNPDVEDGLVAWEQRDATNSDVVLEDLATGERKTVASGPAWQDSPAVGDVAVIWREEGDSGDYDVRGHDLAEGRGIEVAAGDGDQYAPAIDGRLVVWVHKPGGNADVRGKDLSTGETFTVAQGSSQQETPAASGETVLWEVQRDGEIGFGTFDLQGSRLDLAPGAPANLTAKGSGGGVALDWNGNADTDLAGYNVYRAGSEGGEYEKLNTRGPLSASSFSDDQAPRGTKSYYRVTAVDAAGSESAAARASAVAPKATRLTLSASSALLDHTIPNASTTLSGQLSAEGTSVSGKKVVLERKPLGSSAFVPVAGGELTTDAGAFSLAGLKPERNTAYRARFVTDAEELQSATSPTVTVEVKLLVSTSLSATRVKLGGSVGVSGSVFPINAGNVTLNITRNGVPLIKIDNVPLQSSRFSRLHRPPTTGLYTVTVTPTGYPQHLVTTSTRTFSVTAR